MDLTPRFLLSMAGMVALFVLSCSDSQGAPRGIPSSTPLRASPSTLLPSRATPVPSPTARPAELVQVTVNEPFTLRLGQRAEVASAYVEMTFDRVSNDSRCPIDVVCVRAGDATVHLTVQGAGDNRVAIKLVVGPENQSAATARLNELAVTALELAPPPISTRQVPQPEYVLTLVIRKG